MEKEQKKAELRSQVVCNILGEDEPQPQSPVKAIRKFCEGCYCGQLSGECSVQQCVSKNRCPLWPFRFASNPFNIKKMSDEQRQAASERMKGMRGSKDEEEADDE